MNKQAIRVVGASLFALAVTGCASTGTPIGTTSPVQGKVADQPHTEFKLYSAKRPTILREAPKSYALKTGELKTGQHLTAVYGRYDEEWASLTLRSGVTHFVFGDPMQLVEPKID